MAAFLVLQVRMGKVILGRVPERWRAEVQALLDSDEATPEG